MHTIYLALGSNVGDSEKNINLAIELLSKEISNIVMAPIYISKAVGYTDQPDFYNTALKGNTDVEPTELLTFVKEIEQEVGRIHRFRWGPREIDIDIIFYNDHIFKTDDLEIPHPRAHERDFVLRPISDIDPTVQHPVLSRSVTELLTDLSSQQLAIVT